MLARGAANASCAAANVLSKRPGRSSAVKEEVMDAAQIIKHALETNPGVRLVLEVATRAREAESKEPPRELGASTKVTAIPNNPQCGVSSCN